ncbi:metal-sensitive transcriptional regulator [Gulosibacter chungangensis]|uniref:Metal-sensitive transcriptional regulator n=1 Tax=Gulosibacter chungangensis TaxID=979746 RepID=A0A7J5B865_9MICO|nr:metal-sensitive transcriptional regulator [Gulosibacter chungangensis]KAB1641438.1 metal-sensitive transcriptional regulator [Gulosibacter chungangensis]
MSDATAPDLSTASRDEEAKRKVVNRLRRAHGQLAAVISAVEDDAHCRDVVHQLAAVTKALDRAGFLIISSALKECLTAPDGEPADQDELERLFLSLA